MTFKELKKKMRIILRDNRSGIFAFDENEWNKQHDEYTKQKALQKSKERYILEQYFKRKEYLNGTWCKKLRLRLTYMLKNKKGETQLPNHIIKEMARCLLPDIIAYCESEEGKSAFEKWKEKEKENSPVLKKTDNNTLDEEYNKCSKL